MNNLGMARQPDMYRGGPPMCPNDFKPPTETQMPSAPSNPKKRRKANSNAANNAIQPTPPPTPADLLPPPLTGYGDTIVASNPFDDTPLPSSMSSMSHMGHMNHHPHMPYNPHHMGGPPMRAMGPGMMMGGPMGPGSMNPMNPHMNNRGGGMSPMPQMSLSPMGGPVNSMSPMSGGMPPMGRSMSGSPLSIGPQMGQSLGSPMSANAMNSINSPLGNAPNMNGPPMGNHQMHSPSMPPGNRMNGMNSSQQSPHPQMNMPPLQNMNPVNAGPNMMNSNNNNSNSNNPSNNANNNSSNNNNNSNNNSNNGSNTPVTTNNSPTAPLHSGGPNNSNNNLPGSNNGPNTPTNPNLSNATNSSNPMNQMMHNMGNMGPNMSGGPNMGQMMGNNPNMPGMPPSGPMGMYSAHKPMPVSAGKVYPADTPMVFNPQNPNAPPIYPCGICHKEVHDNDQGILCESGCNFWFHRTCSGLTEAAFQLIHFEVYAEWCCDKCLASKNIPMVKFKP